MDLLVVPHVLLCYGLGHQRDEEDDQAREDEGDWGKVQEVEVADGLDDPLRSCVRQSRPTGRRREPKLEDEADYAETKTGQNAPKCTLFNVQGVS